MGITRYRYIKPIRRCNLSLIYIVLCPYDLIKHFKHVHLHSFIKHFLSFISLPLQYIKIYICMYIYIHIYEFVCVCARAHAHIETLTFHSRIHQNNNNKFHVKGFQRKAYTSHILESTYISYGFC